MGLLLPQKQPALLTQPALMIGGPTASGKSAIAVQIALEMDGEILNADAFQIYRGLPLLTAQPDAQEQAGVPHHLLGEFDLREAFDAARYVALAHERIAAIWARGRLPIMVGGTGLYLRSVLYGFSSGLPKPDPELRATLEHRALSDLSRELLEKDPAAAHGVDLQNPRRVIRALEVCLLTGKPFTSFREDRVPPAIPAGLWLTRPRAELHTRIETRTSGLFAAGVEDEVKTVLKELGTTACQAIGLKQVTKVLSGETSRAEAIAEISAATRQYARRQETWFRKETALIPCAPEQAHRTALELLAQRRAQFG